MRVAETVKIEKIGPNIEYSFLDYGENIWYRARSDIEWQGRVNLNIRPDIKGFFFDIKENNSISKVYDDYIE